MPSVQARLLYALLRRLRSPFDASVSLEKQRTSVVNQARLARMPRGVDVEEVTVGDLPAEWLRPRGAGAGHLLFLHGGGYTMGSCSTHRTLVARIAAACCMPALSLGYRLAPEHPFPAAIQDAIAAHAWLKDQDIDEDDVVLAGDSAGAGLAVALAVDLRNRGELLPKGLVCMSGWFDLTLSGETMVTCARSDPFISRTTSALHASRYAGQHDLADPQISPLFADLRGLPPILLQVGQHEVLRSDSERLAQRALATGVDARLEIWEGMWHDWHAAAGLLPEASRAIGRIGDFVRELVGAER